MKFDLVEPLVHKNLHHFPDWLAYVLFQRLQEGKCLIYFRDAAVSNEELRGKVEFSSHKRSFRLLKIDAELYSKL